MFAVLSTIFVALFLLFSVNILMLTLERKGVVRSALNESVLFSVFFFVGFSLAFFLNSFNRKIVFSVVE